MSTLRCSDADDCLEIYLTSTNVNEINERHRSSHKYAASFTRKLSNLFCIQTERLISQGPLSFVHVTRTRYLLLIRNYLVLAFVKVVKEFSTLFSQ